MPDNLGTLTGRERLALAALHAAGDDTPAGMSRDELFESDRQRWRSPQQATHALRGLAGIGYATVERLAGVSRYRINGAGETHLRKQRSPVPLAGREATVARSDDRVRIAIADSMTVVAPACCPKPRFTLGQWHEVDADPARRAVQITCGACGRELGMISWRES